ncbi:Acg family FMN-binding oxidoreductase [Kitasatospora sp. NPDC056138]|uniref:Acg family FMN-binding oxidoreductase n=1 Tax=Kitasatospora sp. NPDC056138 TaxID=3345724 RepID=UPI0035DBA645
MAAMSLDTAALEKLVAAAVAAPSIHNTQPWHYRLRSGTGTLEVRSVPERSLPAIDPDGRALHISVGAAVLNLRTAARHLGWAPEVRLLPDPAEPELLATVRLAEPSQAQPPGTAELYEAIRHRHTVRTPFGGPPVPAEVRGELVEAAHAEQAVLYFPDRKETARLLHLTSEAERRSTTDPVRRSESRNWIQGPAGGPFGIPASSLGPQDTSGRMPMRDYAGLRPAEHLRPETFEAEPCVAVLATERDRREDWLRAGLALENVLLTATVHRVRASLLHQAMEWPYLRWEARDPHLGPEYVQILIRLGHGPEGEPTPRLPLSEVLDVDGG